MDQFFPAPTIATNLTTTMSTPYSMPVPRTRKAWSLKSWLDEALSKFWSQVPLWPELKFDDSNYEVKLENILDLAKACKNNKELQYLYHLGKYLSQDPKGIDSQQKNHLIRSFLHDYFSGEEEAITYLEDVMMHHIFYISSQDCNIILLLKPPSITPQSPRYEPEEPDWIINQDFMFSPLNPPPSPQHPLSVSEMWCTSPDPTRSNNKHHYDDAEDLEADYDEPLFLTCPLDVSLLATSSLLATKGPEYQETPRNIKHCHF